ncbi:MAG: ABC transporter permease [Acidobacteriota bacterium]|nr:ABC transporter permease [Acidobacteriota bacterium]
MLKHLWQDLRFGLRVLWKHPGFAAVAVLTLALGIGASTAIYSVLHAAFFAEYPLTEPDRLLRVYGEDRSRSLSQLNMSVPKFQFMRDQQTVFSGLGAANFTAYTLLDRSEPVQVNGASATANFLQTFGAAPVLGRFFEPSEEQGPPVAVLSETLWRERFGADPAVLGRGITLSGVSYTVVGVAPRLPGFWQAEVWVTRPFELPGIAPELLQRGVSYLLTVGRLKPGVTAAAAQQEMELITGRYRADYPDKVDSSWNLVTVPLRDDIVGTARSPLFTLFAAVALVMLIACANVANLMLVRFAHRRREIALRAALGASRRRVVQQFLVESLLLSVLAGGLGLLLAMWSLPALVGLAQNFITFSGDIRISLPVLGATLGVALLTGLLIGVYPALQASRGEPATVLREGGRGMTGGRGQHLMRSFLVAGQVAVTLMLLAGAALLTTSFLRLQNQTPGFRPDGVFVASMTLPPSRYPDIEAQSRFYLRLAEEMRRTPGVAAASLIQGLPLSSNNTRAPYARADGDVPPVKDRPLGQTRSIIPGYFSAMEIPLLAGRDFTDRDVSKAPQVVIISRSTARRLFPDADPVGRRILMGTNNNVGLEMEVVGVAGDVRSLTLAQVTEVEFYRPVMQRQSNFMQVVVRTPSDPAAFAGTAASVLKTLDPELPLTNPTALSAVVGQSLSQQRLLFTLLGLFAALALVLAAVGVYSVVAYTVTLRTNEIGVRMALGARPRVVLRLIISQAMRPVLLGAVVGLAGCLALGRLFQSQLYEVSAFDPALLAAACAGLVVVAVVACWFPARRAMRVDPMVALRFQ